jgi:hypothetical protein
MTNLEGCISLKDLNLERNNIIELEYYNYFKQIRGLSMCMHPFRDRWQSNSRRLMEKRSLETIRRAKIAHNVIK